MRARSAGAPTVYELTITLADITPRVWRGIRVSGRLTLERLHTVIQKAMGWRGAHLYEFLADGRRYGVPNPESPEYKAEKAWLTMLAGIAPEERARFECLYDLGDNWAHEVVVDRVESPANRYAIRNVWEESARVRRRTAEGRRATSACWRFSRTRNTRSTRTFVAGSAAGSIRRSSTSRL